MEMMHLYKDANRPIVPDGVLDDGDKLPIVARVQCSADVDDHELAVILC